MDDEYIEPTVREIASRLVRIDSFYKYGSFEGGGSPTNRKIFSERVSGLIYLPGRDVLNDKNELRPRVQYRSLSRKEMIREVDKVSGYLVARNPKLNRKVAKKEAKKLIRKFVAHPEALEKELHRELQDVGIYSLSASLKNEALWERYAAGGRGYAIEYSQKVIADLMDDLAVLFDVVYSDQRPFLPWASIDDDTVHTRWIQPAMGTKKLSWQAEREWRLVFNGKANQKLKLPNGAVTAVYLGRNAEADSHSFAEKVCDTNKIPLKILSV